MSAASARSRDGANQALENAQVKNLRLTVELWGTGERSLEAHDKIAAGQVRIAPQSGAIKVLGARR